jgi:predicted amidohydrolase
MKTCWSPRSATTCSTHYNLSTEDRLDIDPISKKSISLRSIESTKFCYAKRVSENASQANKLPLIAGIQLNSSADIGANLDFTFSQLKIARDNGVFCAVLPENFAWMGNEHQAKHITEDAESGRVRSFLSRSASDLGLWIIGGSHRLRVAGDKHHRVTNTTLVFNPEGEQVARYDKIHLFDADVNDGTPYRESATFKAGESLAVVDMGFTRVGLSICYDIRFPQMYQALRSLGAEVIVVPAAFTVPTGRAHWKPLLRARAIENQVYIIAAAQCGTHSNGRKTWGHSLCIDPWGEVVSEQETQPGIVYCQIDDQLIHRIRKEMPVIAHHRPGIF